MKQTKNKGFSMIELLGTIVILGILSAVAIVSTRYLRGKARTNHYESQSGNLMAAAQSFVGDNSSFLPKNIGQRVTVTLKQLMNNNYIDELKDYKKDDCDEELSTVDVYKYAKDKYTYTVNLVCDDYTTEFDGKYGFGPKITEADVVADKKFSFTIEAIDSSEEAATSSKNKIVSYKYILYYKNEADTYVEEYNSGDIEAGIVQKVEAVDVNLNSKFEQEIAEYKLKVTAVDIYGNATTKEFEDHLEIEAPACPEGTKTEQEADALTIAQLSQKDRITVSNPNSEWVKDSRTITISCNEEAKEGCQKSSYTKTFTEDTDIGSITLEGLFGRSSTCYFPVNIDNEPPEVEVKNSYGTNWANANSLSTKDYTLTINATDNIGISSYTYKDPNSSAILTDNTSIETYVLPKFTTDRNEKAEITVCDAANNCTTVSSDIKIDTQAPTLAIQNPYLNTWPSKSVVDSSLYKLTLYSSEAAIGSGIAGYSYKYDGEEAVEYEGSAGKTVFETTPFTAERKENVTISVCDNAGNCRSGSSLIQIDKTPPNAPEVTATYNYDATKSEGNKATIYEPGTELPLYTGRVYIADMRYSSPIGASATDKNHTIASGVSSIQISRDGTNWYEYVFNSSNDLYYASGYSNHIRYLRAIDRAGNVSENNNFSINITNDASGLTCPTYTVTKLGTSTTVNKETWINSKLTVNYDFSGSTATTYKWYTRTGTSGTWAEYANNPVPATKKIAPNFNGDGIRQGKVIISDGTNTKECLTNYYYVDTTAPTCSISKSGTSGSNGWYKSNVTVSLSRSDLTSGIASYGLSTTANTYNSKASVNQGNTSGATYYGVVRDQAGNTGTCSTTLKVDATAPTCSIAVSSGTAGSNGWYKSNVTVSLTRSGATGYGMSTSNSATYNSTTSLTRSSDTSGLTYYGFVKDDAGNTNTCSLKVKVDKTNPPCALEIKDGTKGNNNYYTSDVKFGFTSLDGVTSYGITSSATATYNSKKTLTRTVDTTGTKYYGYTKAESGRTASCNITIKKDATAPAGGSISPSAGTYTKMNPVKLNCADATSGIYNSKIAFNGTTYGNKKDGTQKVTFNFTTAVSNKTATFTCVDNAGNKKEATRKYTVKNECPDGETIFGRARDTANFTNTARNIDSRTQNFTGKWCHSNGKTCDAPYGYMRICTASWCEGLTAEEINNKYDCGYVRFWCTC